MSETRGDDPEIAKNFESGLDLVEKLARRAARNLGRHVELDDLMSYGREGLLDAARRYDASRGVPFRAFATFRIRGAIIDGLRQLSHLPRRVHERLSAAEAANRYSEGGAEDSLTTSGRLGPSDADKALADHLAGMATAMALGMVATRVRPEDDDLTGTAGPEDPERQLTRAQLAVVVRRSLDSLPMEEATLVRRHYLEGERFDHVAAELGLSKSWASRLHTRALGRLAKSLNALADEV